MNLLISYEIQGEDHNGRARIRDDYIKPVLGGFWVGGSVYWVENSRWMPSAVHDSILKILGRPLRPEESLVVVEIARNAWTIQSKTGRTP